MNPQQRDCALGAIQQVCRLKDWTLLAVHVRSTHVHVVIAAAIEPARIMNGLKNAISRTLNRADRQTDQRRWSRHGSTRFLWSARQVKDAITYVVEKQGEPMSVYAKGWKP
ncbi:MAG: transposase [Bryobacteraceae bacterium]